MSILLYARPYDISAEGFYFRSLEEYKKNVSALKNEHGQPVEEFEIQFIDGEFIDAAFADTWQLDQINFAQFLEVSDEWDEEEKLVFIIAVGEGGYTFDPDHVTSSDFEVDIYHESSMRDLAVQFVEDGLFGEVPDPFRFYIDYDAIARDLSVDYSQTEIAGVTLIYRMT